MIEVPCIRLHSKHILTVTLNLTELSCLRFGQLLIGYIHTDSCGIFLVCFIIVDYPLWNFICGSSSVDFLSTADSPLWIFFPQLIFHCGFPNMGFPMLVSQFGLPNVGFQIWLTQCGLPNVYLLWLCTVIWSCDFKGLCFSPNLLFCPTGWPFVLCLAQFTYKINIWLVSNTWLFDFCLIVNSGVLLMLKHPGFQSGLFLYCVCQLWQCCHGSSLLSIVQSNRQLASHGLCSFPQYWVGKVYSLTVDIPDHSLFVRIVTFIDGSILWTIQFSR